MFKTCCLFCFSKYFVLTIPPEIHQNHVWRIWWHKFWRDRLCHQKYQNLKNLPSDCGQVEEVQDESYALWINEHKWQSSTLSVSNICSFLLSPLREAQRYNVVCSRDLTEYVENILSSQFGLYAWIFLSPLNHLEGTWCHSHMYPKSCTSFHNRWHFIHLLWAS